MSAILVSHPHVAAFSVGVAQGLARADRLAGFVTGVAFRDASWSGRLATALAAKRRVVKNRIVGELPKGRLHSLRLVELAARLAAKVVGGAGLHLESYDSVFTAHDAAVALSPWPRETTGVYAYEDAALWTFHRAQRRGLARIWDLPLPHYLTIERIMRDELDRWPRAALGPPHSEPTGSDAGRMARSRWRRRSPSPRASQSSRWKTWGCDVPSSSTPYGFPVDAFAPRESRPQGPFTVLAVGTHDLRKGTPYLLEAWKRAAIPEAELHLVGPLRLAKSFLDDYAGMFRHWPHVPRSELPAHYAAADLCAFPTLGDGFGLVIQESMCCGTPVVTTPCGGGPGMHHRRRRRLDCTPAGHRRAGRAVP